MTTELTLREKVISAIKTTPADLSYNISEVVTTRAIERALDKIADLLSATGAPAYIRVADDLRGVVFSDGDEDGR